MNRKEIIKHLSEIEWAYATYDQNNVLQEFQNKICRAARLNGSLIPYSNLVSGIEFSFSNHNNGEPFVIDVTAWSGLDRRIIGDCLGYLSYRSMQEGGFMASVIVGGLAENRPSMPFFQWTKEIGLIQNTSENQIMNFWVPEVDKAVKWYKANPKGFIVEP